MPGSPLCTRCAGREGLALEVHTGALQRCVFCGDDTRGMVALRPSHFGGFCADCHHAVSDHGEVNGRPVCHVSKCLCTVKFTPQAGAGGTARVIVGPGDPLCPGCAAERGILRGDLVHMRVARASMCAACGLSTWYEMPRAICQTPGCDRPIPRGGEGSPEVCPRCLAAHASAPVGVAWYWGDSYACRACDFVDVTAGQRDSCSRCGYAGRPDLSPAPLSRVTADAADAADPFMAVRMLSGLSTQQIAHLHAMLEARERAWEELADDEDAEPLSMALAKDRADRDLVAFIAEIGS